MVIKDIVCVGGATDEKKSNGGTQYYQQHRIYYGDIALAMPANLPNGSYMYIVKEEVICCKLDKMPKGKLVKSITDARVCDLDSEVASTVCARYYKGLSAHKDNMVLIKQNTKDGFIKCKIGGCFDASFPESTTRRGRVQGEGDLVPTITVAGAESLIAIETRYRIRRLTPKECWRLMGYLDSDYDKAEKVTANTQLYKQAGNAIVKQVLMAIFSQLNIKGVKAWNDMTETEKRAIIKKTTMAGE